MSRVNQHGAGSRSVYSKKEQSWKQIGGDLDVEFFVGAFEHSMISLSEDGRTIAIGSLLSWLGSVRMYKNDNSTWVQMGADIVGDEFMMALVLRFLCLQM